MIKGTCRRLLEIVSVMALSGSAQAAILSITPTDQIVNAGDEVILDVVISGLGVGVAPSLGTYDITLDFNPSVLSFNSVTFGDPVFGNQLDIFGFGVLFPRVSETLGSVSFSETSLDSAADLNSSQLEAFTLAQLSFQAVDTGFGDIGFGSVVLGDADANAIDFTVEAARVEVVPLPQTLALIVIGLLCIRFTRFAG